MSTYHIVVTRTIPQLEQALADAGLRDISRWDQERPIPSAELERLLPEADGLLCMPTDRIGGALLAAAGRLRVISQFAAGVDNIDLDAATSARVAVGHTPDVLTETTADTAFALLAAATRRIIEGADYVRQDRWHGWDPQLLLGGDLHGTTIGIVGLGRVGRAVARRATGFGMTVLYVGGRAADDAELATTGRLRECALDEMLPEVDHLVLTAPLTDSTRGLIGAEEFRRMRPTATLVNVARGPLVQHEALYAALRDGVIAAAALDVTDPEPPDPRNPLLALSNCIVTPHIGSASVRTRQRMALLAVRNLAAGLIGEPLPACANGEALRADQPLGVKALVYGDAQQI